MSVTSLGGTPETTMRALLEAGVHFGHQAKRWNPKMKPYIYSERNGIHIIDLDQTRFLLEDALKFVEETTAAGGKILFVGTKKQAQDVVARDASRSGQFYVNRRWLGGTLTNFSTIRQRLKTLKDLQRQDLSGELDMLPKQEASVKRGELERLERTLGGMRDMVQLPAAIFVVDPKREHLAITEARKLKLPVIAIADTNADPDLIDFIIPGNDDAIRSVRLISGLMSESASQGIMELEAYTADDENEMMADAIAAEAALDTSVTEAIVADGTADTAVTEAVVETIVTEDAVDVADIIGVEE